MSYDYTQNDVPFDNTAEIDNFELGDVATIDKTPEQIVKENTYTDIEPGEHTLLLHSFGDAPKQDMYQVNVNGVKMAYHAYSVRVKFCLPDNPKATVEDYFVFPPEDPSQVNAYCNGIPDGKKQAGFSANKFYHFIGALGFVYPAGGKLPPEARRLGNWKGRTIRATIQAGTSYIDKKTGLEKPGRNQIKLFSYKPSDATIQGIPPGMRATQGGGGASQPHYRQPAAAPAARPAGLDNL